MSTSRPRPAQCIFCGRGGDLTDEDAIPKWIGRMFSRGGTRRAQTPGGQQLTRRNIGAQLVVRNVVCADCNGGWMSRLQTQAKPFLEQMISGNRIVIGPLAQRILAAWATMTAMVIDFADPPMSEPIYEQQGRTGFYQNHRIPPISTVWLAHRESLPTLGIVRWQIDSGYVTTQPTDPATLGAAKNVYSSTAIFGHLVLQLLVQRPDPSIPAPDLARLWTMEDEWGARHVRFRLLPPQVPIGWPPPLPLQEAEIDAFAERWARLGP